MGVLSHSGAVLHARVGECTHTLTPAAKSKCFYDNLKDLQTFINQPN